MSTNNPDNAMNRLYRTRWFMPAFCVFLAALMFAAFAIGGDAASGASPPPCSCSSAPSSTSARAARRRSPASAAPAATSAGSASTSTPPRSAGMVLVLVIIGAWLVEIAQGKDGSPYAALGAVGGLAYVLAVAFLRWRS